MQNTIRTSHARLVVIMKMIEKADSMIVYAKKQMQVCKYDHFSRNEYARQANRYRRIRNRLYASYAGVIAVLTQKVINTEILTA